MFYSRTVPYYGTLGPAVHSKSSRPARKAALRCGLSVAIGAICAGASSTIEHWRLEAARIVGTGWEASTSVRHAACQLHKVPSKPSLAEDLTGLEDL